MITVAAHVETAQKSNKRLSRILIAIASLLAAIVMLVATDYYGLTRSLPADPAEYMVGP